MAGGQGSQNWNDAATVSSNDDADDVSVTSTATNISFGEAPAMPAPVAAGPFQQHHVINIAENGVGHAMVPALALQVANQEPPAVEGVIPGPGGFGMM